MYLVSIISFLIYIYIYNLYWFQCFVSAEFNYSPYSYDVALVEEEGYNRCKLGKNPIIYNTGHDYIQVPEGPSYYICSLNDLCSRGMKVAIIPK